MNQQKEPKTMSFFFTKKKKCQLGFDLWAKHETYNPSDVIKGYGTRRSRARSSKLAQYTKVSEIP